VKMSKANPQRRARIVGAVVVAIVLVFVLCGLGLALAARHTAQAAGEPTTGYAVRELARRFQVPGDKQMMFQFGFTLAGGSDMRQALRDTEVALQRSNAADDLTAPPVATGDALFDRYALAVDAQINAASVNKNMSQALSRAALSDTELAQWEGEFGKDPRYWELRYLCAKGGKAQTPLAAGFNAPSDFLDEARKRGAATANTLLVRYTELREAHAAELKPFEREAQRQAANLAGKTGDPASAAGANAPISAAPVYDDPKAVAIEKRQRVEQLALLNAAVGAGPGEAWPRYMRACYWFEQGEQAKGLDDLAAGNAAPVVTIPQPWPMGLIQASPGQPAPAGSAAVCGEIYKLGLGFNPFSQLHLGKVLDASLACIKPGGDLGPLQTWHQFLCRYAQGAPMCYLAAIAREGALYNYVEENLSSSLTPAQIETLQRCRGARDAFRDGRRAAFMYDAVTSSIPLIPFAGFRAIAVALYLQLSSDWQEFQGGVPGTVMADLSQVHFPELALPECMKKYEAVSLAEARRRSAEQREKNRKAREAKYGAAKGQPGK
jgi:hypothetical protein